MPNKTGSDFICTLTPVNLHSTGSALYQIQNGKQNIKLIAYTSKRLPEDFEKATQFQNWNYVDWQ